MPSPRAPPTRGQAAVLKVGVVVLGGGPRLAREHKKDTEGRRQGGRAPEAAGWRGALTDVGAQEALAELGAVAGG